jgi:hypothetical protein
MRHFGCDFRDSLGSDLNNSRYKGYGESFAKNLRCHVRSSSLVQPSTKVTVSSLKSGDRKMRLFSFQRANVGLPFERHPWAMPQECEACWGQVKGCSPGAGARTVGKARGVSTCPGVRSTWPARHQGWKAARLWRLQLLRRVGPQRAEGLGLRAWRSNRSAQPPAWIPRREQLGREKKEAHRAAERGYRRRRHGPSPGQCARSVPGRGGVVEAIHEP